MSSDFEGEEFALLSTEASFTDARIDPADDHEMADDFSYAEVAQQLIDAPDRLSPEEREQVGQLLGIDAERLARFGQYARYERLLRQMAQRGEEQARKDAETDPVTGVMMGHAALRRSFGEAGIESVISNRPMAILFADMNGLGDVNMHGQRKHRTGDLYLRAVSNSLASFFTEHAYIIRLHKDRGDEFIIVTTFPGGVPAEPHFEEQWDGIFARNLAQLNDHVHTAVSGDDDLLGELPFESMPSLTPERLGASIGGVYGFPIEVEKIGERILDRSRKMNHVIERILEIADRNMYITKHPEEFADETPRLCFKFEDIFPEES